MISKQKLEVIRQRFVKIEKKRGGRLTPDDVLADAQDPSSPTHAYFTWDDSKAGHAYRLEEARTLITSVRVVFRTETTTVTSVAYVRDPSVNGNEQGYVAVARLRSNTDAARDALVAEFTRVADMLRRARELAVALHATEDVEALLQSVVGLKRRFESEPAQTRQ
jgi:hypothetical protein